MEDLTPFRRRFLSLGYSKGLMYPKIIALFYPSIEFVASNFLHKYFGYDYGAVYKERKTHRIQSR